jgi:hypothetical protein
MGADPLHPDLPDATLAVLHAFRRDGTPHPPSTSDLDRRHYWQAVTALRAAELLQRGTDGFCWTSAVTPALAQRAATAAAAAQEVRPGAGAAPGAVPDSGRRRRRTVVGVVLPLLGLSGGLGALVLAS